MSKTIKGHQYIYFSEITNSWQITELFYARTPDFASVVKYCEKFIPPIEHTKETKFKTDGSLSELGKLPIDDLKTELLKYSHEELAKIAMAGVFASNMMMEER